MVCPFFLQAIIEQNAHSYRYGVTYCLDRKCPDKRAPSSRELSAKLTEGVRRAMRARYRILCIISDFLIYCRKQKPPVTD